MRRHLTFVTAFGAIVATLFFVSIAWAAEGETPAKGGAAKGAKGAAAKGAAAKGAPTKGAKGAGAAPAAKDNAKGKAAAKTETAPAEEGAAETPEGPTLEKRLKGLQDALEAATSKTHKVPGKIDALVDRLEEGKKGLINPESGKQIQVNAAMLNKYESSIRDPKTFITFYADQDTPGKGRAVIFADGKLKYLQKEAFDKALEASKPKTMTREEIQAAREEALDAQSGGHDR